VPFEYVACFVGFGGYRESHDATLGSCRKMKVACVLVSRGDVGDGVAVNVVVVVVDCASGFFVVVDGVAAACAAGATASAATSKVSLSA
jgi:hypothetical protein